MRIPLLVMLAIPIAAQAQGLQAVRPLPGYACAMLNVSPAVLRDGPLPPVLAEPRAGAVEIGQASAVVIVASPAKTAAGYTAVLHLDGRPGWVESSKLKPYRSASNPNATCTPSLMSDGRPGFR